MERSLLSSYSIRPALAQRMANHIFSPQDDHRQQRFDVQGLAAQQQASPVQGMAWHRRPDNDDINRTSALAQILNHKYKYDKNRNVWKRMSFR